MNNYNLKVKKYKQTIQKATKPTPIYAGGLSLVFIAPMMYMIPKAKLRIATIVNRRNIALDIQLAYKFNLASLIDK